MIELARGSLGVPFAPYGRDLKKGLSCIGLVTVAARAQGVDCEILDAASFVPYHPNLRRATEAIEKDMIRVRQSETRPGDVVLFHIWSPGHPLIEHVGLITGTNPLTVIHSTPVFASQVIEHELDAPMVDGVSTPWSQFVVATYRFSEAAEW